MATQSRERQTGLLRHEQESHEAHLKYRAESIRL